MEGGEQILNLKKFSPGVDCFRLGTIMHEFLHGTSNSIPYAALYMNCRGAYVQSNSDGHTFLAHHHLVQGVPNICDPSVPRIICQ